MGVDVQEEYGGEDLDDYLPRSLLVGDDHLDDEPNLEPEKNEGRDEVHASHN